MNIEKAIKHNDTLLQVGTTRLTSAEVQSISLGNEALKAWKQFREGRWMSGRYDLPGETK